MYRNFVLKVLIRYFPKSYTTIFAYLQAVGLNGLISKAGRRPIKINQSNLFKGNYPCMCVFI